MIVIHHLRKKLRFTRPLLRPSVRDNVLKDNLFEDKLLSRLCSTPGALNLGKV